MTYGELRKGCFIKLFGTAHRVTSDVEIRAGRANFTTISVYLSGAVDITRSYPMDVSAVLTDVPFYEDH